MNNNKGHSVIKAAQNLSNPNKKIIQTNLRMLYYKKY